MGHTPVVYTMTIREALLSVLNEDMAELFSRVVALEMSGSHSPVIATEEEAIAGVDNTKAMTPLRTHQAIAANPGGYLKPADHTKALHDSLGIDADTLDGRHASDLLAFADHTKAMHDSLRIDADTLDGYHSTGIRSKNDSIYLSQGQVIHFSETVGDKIRLHGTQYGIAVNANELTLYTPSGSEIAVRDGAYNGQKLGEVIHTGNVADQEVAMALSMLVSTPGSHLIRFLTLAKDIWSGGPYTEFLTLQVPWLGVTTYLFLLDCNYSGGGNIYFKLNETEYGPYFVPYSGYTDVYLDHAGTGDIHIASRSEIGGGYYVKIWYIKVLTGNVDIPYSAEVTYLSNSLKAAS